MGRGIAAGLLLAASTTAGPTVVPASAAPAGPLVDVLVVGRHDTLGGPRAVRAVRTTITASGRRCAVGSGTPLAALAGLRHVGGPSFRTRDTGGSCSSRVADAGALFVYRVGADANAGRDGWVYKVGRRAGTTGAADPSGPFGTGVRLRSGDRVTWFWCHLSRADSCPRTLELRAAARVAPGAVLHVAVSGFDDRGHGIRMPGATVRLASATARTGADGIAAVRAPTRPGMVRLAAWRSGAVEAFPQAVRVG